MGKLSVKVVPSSAKNAIVGWLGDALKIKVQAPAEKGKANAAVIKLLAAQLGLPQDAIEIVSGQTTATKVLAIHGLETAQIVAQLQQAIA
ncbi:DUF167 domain-containing protein [Almyronema epifaneia]|uniref:UPF0235 protein ACFVKH_00985 n=1 Tax=Almyronema epifaneia S1 TaxID=2991925 RepID=A0ABW6IAX7_9CYAN